MITLANVTKRYATRSGPNTVLDKVSFTLRRGEKLGILGRNGAGKSTLIRLIGGAEQPTAGRVQRDMRVSWPLAFSGGFQGSLTGIDNLRFICRVYGVSADEQIPFLAEFSELGKYLHEPVKHYSAGMRSRLAFGISMAVDFDCFLLDEIMAVGDDRFRARCEYQLFEKRKDRAMIFVSHNPSFMREHCDRALVLNNAKLVPFDHLDEALIFYDGQLNAA
jgi:capsular polysaccharide transport system ATP-binding protein